VLFIVAAGLVAFLLFAGLAIDLSMLYNVKTDLQNAIDSAALAGATQLDGTSNGINQVVTKALSMTNKYRFNTSPVALSAGDVTFSATRDSGYVSQATAAARGKDFAAALKLLDEVESGLAVPEAPHPRHAGRRRLWHACPRAARPLPAAL